uniref:Uncharacterized protein n=1 Tax=Plectus sambesii TaxID=2011161 RepID=A0A914UWH8_9BILA
MAAPHLARLALFRSPFRRLPAPPHRSRPPSRRSAINQPHLFASSRRTVELDLFHRTPPLLAAIVAHRRRCSARRPRARDDGGGGGVRSFGWRRGIAASPQP